MDITCKACGSKLKIPDSKLPPPQVRTVSITCPKCKSKLTIDRAKPDAGLAPQSKGKPKPENVPTPQGGQKPAAPSGDPAFGAEKGGERTPIFDYEYDEDISPLDFYEEGTKLALVMDGDDKHVRDINAALQELAYKVVAPGSIREAMGKMLFHHFDVVMLSDGFDGLALQDSPAVHYLNSLSMSIRRKIYLVLLSRKFKTLDLMKAFAMSANLVVNTDDISNLALILKKGISDHEKFYKVFMDTLVETGKD
jgi:hypothetical protein